MKKLLIAFGFYMLTCFNSTAQVKTLTDLTNYSIQNFGCMLDKNKTVSGYFNFYKGEKLKKKQQEYVLEILDDNLNTVVTKKYIDSKYASLRFVEYNKQALMIGLINYKEEHYKFVQFDESGNKIKSQIVQLTKKDLVAEASLEENNMFSQLKSIDNKGFLFLRYTKDKKLGYKLHFFPTDGSKPWVNGTPSKSKTNEYASFSNVSDKGISLYLFSRKSMLGKTKLLVKVIDSSTGKTILNLNNTDSKTPKLLTNTYFEEDYFVNIGEYFSAEENPIKDVSNGMYFNKYDYSGKQLLSKKISWSNKSLGKFKVADGEKNRNHLFFHEVVKTSSGEYYAIAEQYRRSASATGVLMKGLAIASGGSISGGGTTKLTITNAEIFHFDSEFNLKEITEFQKGKTMASCLMDFGSAPINAHAIKTFGGFDYEYTQKDVEKDRFFSMFTYKEIIKGAKNRYVLKSVNYSKGNLTEDKIYLTNGKIDSNVHPAKAGYVLLSEYNKKAKTLNLHLEKLNL